jgi:hypothetical protein
LIKKKYCDNSTRKIHISNNFILSISLLIMFDTLLLRLSLHCNTPLHFTQLHFTTLIDVSLPLIYPSLHFHLASHIYIFCHSTHHITSHSITRHSTDLILKIISKKVNPFIALKKTSDHFTSLFILFYLFIYLSYQPYTSLYFPIPKYNLLPFTSLPFTFYRPFPSLIYTFLTLVLKICILPWEIPITPSGSLFQSVMVLFTKEYFPISVLCFLAPIFQ